MWIPFPWEFLLPCTALVHTHTHVHVRPVASGFWGSQLHPIPKSNPDVVTSTHYDPIDKLWLATDSHVMNSFLSSHASRPSNQMQSMTLSVQITPIHLPFYSQCSVTFRQRLLSFFEQSSILRQFCLFRNLDSSCFGSSALIREFGTRRV